MRNVLVTGAAGGLGKAIVKKFIEEGDFVYVTDLKLEDAETVAQKYAGKAEALALNVADSDSVHQVIEYVIEKGPLHVLINNAGLQHRDKIEDFPEEKWDLLQDVMLKGPFLMTKYAFPHMKEAGIGRIINISSVHGETATPEKAAYVSAKHGVIGLTKVTALEGAAHNITANAVLPGPVKTPLLIKQLKDLEEQQGLSEKQALAKIVYPRQAMERFIDESEVADGVYFLASNSASAITGETLSISGGI